MIRSIDWRSTLAVALVATTLVPAPPGAARAGPVRFQAAVRRQDAEGLARRSDDLVGARRRDHRRIGSAIPQDTFLIFEKPHGDFEVRYNIAG
jgi:hypothetical protein